VIIYPYTDAGDGSPRLIEEDRLKREAPHVYEHLLSFKSQLRKRQDSRRFYADGPDWYRHLRAGSFRYIRPEKLVLKAISRETRAGILPKQTAFDGANCPAIIIEDPESCDPRYLLGILNSSLATYYLRGVCPPKLSGYVKFSATCLSSLPIRFIDAGDRVQRAMRDRLVTLVEQMIALRDQRAAARTPHDETVVVRQIDAIDDQIDRLVYELYGLSAAEVQVIHAGAESWKVTAKDS
jgi:TaqI-like C-terminal specificity domain